MISIIAMLASLLLPALSKARGMARKAVCMSNLKQVGLALTMYADDYNGWTPCYNDGSVGWSYRLYNGGYAPAIVIGKKTIFICPSYSPKVGYSSATWLYTYGLRANNVSEHALSFRISSSPVKSYNRTTGAFATLENPTQCALVVDSRCVSASWELQYYYWLPGGGSSILKRIHTRHNGTANILFADGHVESCVPSKLEEYGITKYYDEDGSLIE